MVPEVEMKDEMTQLSEWLIPEALRAVDAPVRNGDSSERRRVALIEKEAEVGLTEGEARELESLQKNSARALNIAAPLPFETLERFEKRARDAGIRLDDSEA